jgi:hypothetical protein
MPSRTQILAPAECVSGGGFSFVPQLLIPDPPISSIAITCNS